MVDEDFTVETNEGPVSNEDIQLIKTKVIELMQVKQKKLYDVSAELITTLSNRYGGKWYSNIRPLNVEHGICLHCSVYGR